jgi:hypothetical protein
VLFLSYQRETVFPIWLLGNGWVNKFPRQRRIVGGVVFCGVHVIPEESRRLVLNRTSFFIVVWLYGEDIMKGIRIWKGTVVAYFSVLRQCFFPLYSNFRPTSGLCCSYRSGVDLSCVFLPPLWSAILYQKIRTQSSADKRRYGICLQFILTIPSPHSSFA